MNDSIPFAVCRQMTLAGDHSTLRPVLIALALLQIAAAVALGRAARGEAVTPDLGYGRYVFDALRAGVLFTGACAVASLSALAEPCLFVVHDPPLYVGLLYWCALFAALAFYGGWSLQRDQQRNRQLASQLKEACRNYAPLYDDESTGG